MEQQSPLYYLLQPVFFKQPFSVSFRQLKQSRFWLIPVIYFVWLAFSHFWDASGGYRLRDIERYLILFFVPPAMAVAPDDLKAYINKACIAFITVTVMVCVIRCLNHGRNTR
jgi:hypothetical protein